MKRNIKEILFILMNLELNFSNLYKNISEIDGKYSKRLQTMALVLSREELTHYTWYKELINNESLIDIVIEDDIYENARINLKNFRDSISRLNLTSQKSVLDFAHEYELKNKNTLISIKDFVMSQENTNKDLIIKTIDKLIKIEEVHASNLKRFIRNNTSRFGN